MIRMRLLTRGRRLLLLPAAVLVVLGVSACGADGAPGDDATGDSDGGSITVFAAASLKEPFTALAEQFEDAHPGAEVTLNFAGSSDLATQLVEGAPADVFASADESTMESVRRAELLDGEPITFATNTLQLAVPPDNPAGIASLDDAARPGVKTVVCAVQVPCGAAAARVEEATDVELTPVSEESSVTDVLGKVSSGEADAGLVYVTDVRAAGEAVLGIALPEAADVVNSYPIAALTGSQESGAARDFVDFVVGDDGRAVLEAAGFGAP
ncbi:molybdate ABC transporter substrate-binding protein [uncultured Arthrobacter sp.]|uniref:molybdate ABC transporter substrate-binding protein n=1 Tax=uncultured Arthrobacter sp. TaxID=114050 RepID=UPI00262E43A2|nr:molybdate ABC transporter substrate-binding protein [uncultured Arthrobacter sp.]